MKTVFCAHCNLDLQEHEQVVVSVVKTPDTRRSALPAEYIASVKHDLQNAGPPPGFEEVRRRLSKIDGSMSDEIIAERGDR